MHTSSDLLRDFEDDIKFYRHPKWRADANHEPNRHLLDAEDIGQYR